MIPIAGRDDLVIQVTDDGSRTLMDHAQGVAFHSASGARTETQHVYLDNSGVSDRLRQGLETQVLEIGLGSALGMLMTVDLAITAGCRLQYHAWDLELLDADIFELLNLGQSLEHTWLADSFISWRREIGMRTLPGEYRWEVPSSSSTNASKSEVVLTLSLGDWLKSDAATERLVDAIYYDPFAPSANPELWQVEHLKRVQRILSPRGRLTTYCVSREVRDNFAAAGFHVMKVRGPKGGKREVLIATLTD